MSEVISLKATEKEELYFRELLEKGFPRHPVMRRPTWQQLLWLGRQADGKEKIREAIKKYRALEGAMEADPYRYGHRFWFWDECVEELKENQEALILGGNGSTKTWFLAWLGVKTLIEKARAMVAFFHSSAESSITIQQARVHYFLPMEWRYKKQRFMLEGGRYVDIDTKYTGKNGFPNNRFILPNESQAFFFNYGQDPSKQLVSHKFDMAICDELVTVNHLEEIRYRLWDKKGKLVAGYTPVDGYTPAVRDMLAGSQVLEWRDSELLRDGRNVDLPGAPVGKMPYRLSGRRPKSRVYCWFSEWNKFNDVEELRRKNVGATKNQVKIRAYGWPENQVGTAFPKFGKVNIIKRHVEWEGVACGVVPPKPWEGMYKGKFNGNGICIRVIDPAEAKNWFIKWYWIGQKPQWTVVYREWPDWNTHGEWALPGERADGSPGPAQRSGFGMGIVDYKKVILEAEGWVWDERAGRWDGSKAEKIFESIMDSRMGGAEVPSEEKPTSIIQMMYEEQTNSKQQVVGPSMNFEPAPGNKVKGGIEMLRDRFSYETDKSVDMMNCPKWYVLEDCQQSIYAYREYTGLDGEKGALKDVIDPDRYLVECDTHYVDEKMIAQLSRSAMGF